MGDSYNLNILSLIEAVSVIYFGFVAKQWYDYAKDPVKQYKNVYLLAYSLALYLVLHFLLLIYTLYAIDDLAEILKGAMCGAGVVGANALLEPFILAKGITFFFALFTVSLYSENERLSVRKYDKKIAIFFALFLLSLFAESGLIFSAASTFESSKIVSCCSSLFAAAPAFLTFPIDPLFTAILFNVTVFSVLFSMIYKNALLGFISIFLFAFFAYLSYVYFYSPYIYELPTHKCPYCALSSHYYFIGFAIFIAYFIALQSTLLYFFTYLFCDKASKKIALVAIISVATLTLLLDLQPIIYYLKNGVTLN